MHKLSPHELVQALEWRYATKKFDPSFSIPAEAMEALESALLLSPSSMGLQPWRFVMVQDPEIRKQLRAVSWDQSQVTDASVLVVLAAKKEVGLGDVDHYIQRIADVRDQSPESLNDFKKMMLGFLSSKNSEDIQQWTGRQVYIALGFLLSAAAQLGLDACPMEGLDGQRYDQILGLEGYHTHCVAAVGRRSHEDGLGRLKKVRFPKAEVIAHR